MRTRPPAFHHCARARRPESLRASEPESTEPEKGWRVISRAAGADGKVTLTPALRRRDQTCTEIRACRQLASASVGRPRARSSCWQQFRRWLAGWLARWLAGANCRPAAINKLAHTPMQQRSLVGRNLEGKQTRATSYRGAAIISSLSTPRSMSTPVDELLLTLSTAPTISTASK